MSVKVTENNDSIIQLQRIDEILKKFKLFSSDLSFSFLYSGISILYKDMKNGEEGQ